jgi:hypothetical protein
LPYWIMMGARTFDSMIWEQNWEISKNYEVIGNIYENKDLLK